MVKVSLSHTVTVFEEKVSFRFGLTVSRKSAFDLDSLFSTRRKSAFNFQERAVRVERAGFRFESAGFRVERAVFRV